MVKKKVSGLGDGRLSCSFSSSMFWFLTKSQSQPVVALHFELSVTMRPLSDILLSVTIFGMLLPCSFCLISCRINNTVEFFMVSSPREF